MNSNNNCNNSEKQKLNKSEKLNNLKVEYSQLHFRIYMINIWIYLI